MTLKYDAANPFYRSSKTNGNASRVVAPWDLREARAAKQLLKQQLHPTNFAKIEDMLAKAEGRGAEGREAQGSVSVEEARPWRRERSRLTTCEMEEVRSAETKPRSQSREPEVYRGK